MNAALLKILSELGTEVLILLMKRVALMLQERVDAKGFEQEQAETVHKLCDSIKCPEKTEEEIK